MRKSFLKLCICIIVIFSFIRCTTTSKYYTYGETVFKDNKLPYKYGEYMYIHAPFLDSSDKNSPLKSLTITPEYKIKKLEILSDKLKLVYEEKEYYLDRDFSLDKKDRKSLFYPIYKKGIIVNGDFILYIGKVRIDDKEIVEVPPLKFKKYIEVSQFNPFLGGLNIDTKVEDYSGLLEDYKGD